MKTRAVVVCALGPFFLAQSALGEPTTLARGEATAGIEGVGTHMTLARGRPDAWLGLEAQGAVKPDHLGGYLGLRLGTPHVDVRGGVFGAISVRRSFLPPRQTYGREDADLREGQQHARYLGLSSETDLRLAAFGGEFQSATQAAVVLSVPNDRYVFVEHLNVINGPSWLLYQRVGQHFDVGRDVWLGGALEFVWLASRDEGVVRLGPEVRFEPNDWFALHFILLPTLVSPDRLGLTGATFDLGAELRFW